MVVVFDGVWVLVLSGCLKADLSHHLWPQSGKFWYKNSKHQSHNWGMQIIDGCSLKLCVATHSVVSSSTAPQTKLNAIARLCRDGSIRKYQFTFTFHTTLHHLLTLSIMPICTLLLISHHPLISLPSSSLPLLYSYSSLNPSSLHALSYFPIFLHPFRFSHPLSRSLSIIHYTLHSYSPFLSLSLSSLFIFSTSLPTSLPPLPPYISYI